MFGAWTAYQLQQSGATVVLLDAYGAGNSRASSGGETRIIRMGYGPDEIYTRSAQRSFRFWEQLFAEVGQSFFRRTGVLWLARENDAYCLSTIKTLRGAGVSFAELSRETLAERYPQFDFGNTAWGIIEPESGVMLARQALILLVSHIRQNGVEFHREAVLPPANDGILKTVTTRSGRSIVAQTFVFACGPWLPKLFSFLNELIHVTRQEVFFFGAPAGELQFSVPEMPTFIDFNDLVYGIPDIDGRGFKVAIDAHGPDLDPDTAQRMVTTEGLRSVRNYLQQRLPALAGAPVLETRVCQYENTSNGDFLIDRHPRYENVWLVGGGSGHGFKHGPAIGEYVVRLILGQGLIEPRYQLATKSKMQRRQVF